MVALMALQSYRSAAAAIGIRFNNDQSNSNQSDRTMSAVGAQQVCPRLALVPWAIAFLSTAAPSTSHSATIRVFGSGLESRGVPFLTVAILSMSLMDTIVGGYDLEFNTGWPGADDSRLAR